MRGNRFRRGRRRRQAYRNGGCCMIAALVPYGLFGNMVLDSLRVFRDSVLLNLPFGDHVVNAYYKVSEIVLG